MTFSNLGPREKEAFFGLLDESVSRTFSSPANPQIPLTPISRYFQSRPEIFGAAQQGPTSSPGLKAPAHLGDGTPGSMMKQAMIANPEATAKVFSAGLRHAASAASPPPPARAAQPAAGPSDEVCWLQFMISSNRD